MPVGEIYLEYIMVVKEKTLECMEYCKATAVL